MENKGKSIPPIAKVGSYGLHVLKNPVGTFSLVGSIPIYFIDENMKTPIFKTMEEAVKFITDKMVENGDADCLVARQHK